MDAEKFATQDEEKGKVAKGASLRGIAASPF
jgi:hypothetical protein